MNKYMNFTNFDFFIMKKFILYVISRLSLVISPLMAILSITYSITSFDVNFSFITCLVSLFLLILSVISNIYARLKIDKIGYCNFTGLSEVTIHLNTSIFFARKNEKPNIFYIMRSLNSFGKFCFQIDQNIIIRIYSPLCDPVVMERRGFKSIRANNILFLMRKSVYLINLLLSRDLEKSKIAGKVDRLADIWIIEAKSFR